MHYALGVSGELVEVTTLNDEIHLEVCFQTCRVEVMMMIILWRQEDVCMRRDFGSIHPGLN